jgi:hypothetical protein
MPVDLSQAVPVATSPQGDEYIPNGKIDLSMATPVPKGQEQQTDYETLAKAASSVDSSNTGISKEQVSKLGDGTAPIKNPGDFFNSLVTLQGEKVYDMSEKMLDPNKERVEAETKAEEKNKAAEMGAFEIPGIKGKIKPIDIATGIAPYVALGAGIGVSWAGWAARTTMGALSFGALSATTQAGEEKSKGSLMTPENVKEAHIAEAGIIGAGSYVAWEASSLLKPFGNAVKGTLTMAGLGNFVTQTASTMAGTGAVAATTYAIYGEDLKAAFEDSGKIGAYCLMSEVLSLGHTMLGRGLIEDFNRTMFRRPGKAEEPPPILVSPVKEGTLEKYPATSEPSKPEETKPAKGFAFTPIDVDHDSDAEIRFKLQKGMEKMAEQMGITDKPKIVGAAVKLRGEPDIPTFDEGLRGIKSDISNEEWKSQYENSVISLTNQIKRRTTDVSLKSTLFQTQVLARTTDLNSSEVQKYLDKFRTGFWDEHFSGKELKVMPKEIVELADKFADIIRSKISSGYIEGPNHDAALKKAGLSKDTAVEGKDFDAYLKDNNGKYYTRDEAKEKFGIWHSGQIPPADLEVNTKALGTPKPLKITNPDSLRAIEALGDEAGKMDMRLIPGWAEIGSALEESHKAYMENLEPLNINKIAHMTAADLRERLGRIAINMDRLEASLMNAKKMFAKASKASIIDTFTRAERGEAQDTPELQQVYDTLQSIFKYQRGRLESLGHGAMENFIENYLPHIWVKPGMAGKLYAQIMGKRPFEGPASFKKHRTIMDFNEGIKQGLEPVSWNPVDITMLKAREMERYIAAHGALAANKDLGFVKFVRTGGEKPEGWVKINDKMSDVYSKNKAGEVVRRGTYFAHPECARIFNNYLSPGLRGNWLYDTYRGAGNGLVQFRLGLSLFHLGFTSLDATISKTALGLNKMASGDFVGMAKEIATSPLAPITNAMQGKKLLDAWHGKMPGTDYETYAQLYALGGGRSGMDDFYATAFNERVQKALKEGKWLTAGLNYPGMLLQKVSTPLMKYVVPWQKAGVFMDLMKFECEKNPGMTHAELRDKAQKIVDSVDNRLGQLTYDNLFVDKTLKDLGMASVQSLGWNIGTVREIGGGASDFVRQSVRAVKGKNAQFTYRMAYVMAMPAVVGLYSAVYQYMHTGIWPQEMKDYFYPKNGGIDKNGQPQRVNLPSYAKDIYHFSEDPFKTVTNKLNPVWSMMAELKDNKDFFGNAILNEDDNDVQKAVSALKFVLGGYEPYSFQNMMKQTAGPKWESFVGVTPAPYDINMNDLERRLYKLASEKHQEAPRTTEVAQHSKVRSDIMSQYFRTKDPQVLDDAVDAGKISQKEANQIKKEAEMSNVERLSQKLTPEELMRVEKRNQPITGIKRTPEEEQDLKDIIEKKRESREKSGTWTDEAEQMYQEMVTAQ